MRWWFLAVGSCWAEKHEHCAIMTATSLPVQTSKSNIFQLLCKLQHHQWPARRELWEIFPKMFPSLLVWQRLSFSRGTKVGSGHQQIILERNLVEDYRLPSEWLDSLCDAAIHSKLLSWGEHVATRGAFILVEFLWSGDVEAFLMLWTKG